MEDVSRASTSETCEQHGKTVNGSFEQDGWTASPCSLFPLTDDAHYVFRFFTELHCTGAGHFGRNEQPQKRCSRTLFPKLCRNSSDDSTVYRILSACHVKHIVSWLTLRMVLELLKSTKQMFTAPEAVYVPVPLLLMFKAQIG